MLNKMKLNGKIKKQQLMTGLGLGFGLILFMTLLSIAAKHSKKHGDDTNKLDFTGVMSSEFSEKDSESAMTSQQLELESLKKQIKELTSNISKLQKENTSQSDKLSEKILGEVAKLRLEQEESQKAQVLALNSVSPNHSMSDGGDSSLTLARLNKPRGIYSVSYQERIKRHQSDEVYKSHLNYVPSGTFAKAIILGGVDADASVDGQNKNNGVMLFKVINQGVLPNGKRSHLQGCLVTGSAYGDISSERAYVKLDKISCAFDGKPIVDKSVTGWAFFAGKVGIKGVPMMRDSKIVTWAGVSGALSGLAQAAQYAQSVQNFGIYGGATSVVPSSNIGPYAAYGGATKATEELSKYYIKRAEQYHPVIQVGSGNKVSIVFKDGFFLFDEELERKGRASNTYTSQSDPIVPQEVLTQINQASLGDNISGGNK